MRGSADTADAAQPCVAHTCDALGSGGDDSGHESLGFLGEAQVSGADGSSTGEIGSLETALGSGADALRIGTSALRSADDTLPSTSNASGSECDTVSLLLLCDMAS